jgi:hypothetical protein
VAKEEWGVRNDFRGGVEDREGEIETGLTVVAAAALGGSAVIHCEAWEGLIQILKSGRSAGATPY